MAVDVVEESLTVCVQSSRRKASLGPFNVVTSDTPPIFLPSLEFLHATRLDVPIAPLASVFNWQFF